MKLRESRERHVDIFCLEGEIDLHYAPGLCALFQAKVGLRCPALIVDLSRVPFDSSGIAILLEYLRDAAEFSGRFCIAVPTAQVSPVFDIIQLEKAIPISKSAAEATAAIANRALTAPAQPLFRPAAPAAAESMLNVLPTRRAA